MLAIPSTQFESSRALLLASEIQSDSHFPTTFSSAFPPDSHVWRTVGIFTGTKPGSPPL
jgi:hypothetical protein